MGPGCLGGADGSSPACYCCGRLWRGWRGEERVSRDVAAAAVPGAWVPYLAARLPAPPPMGSQGVGGCRLLWEEGDRENCPAAASSSSFAVPGSCQAQRSDPRELGSGRPAPPRRPGAPAPLAAAARPPVNGCPARGNARSRGNRLGNTREKLLESLASPEPALGVRLKGCRGSLPGRDVTVSLLISGHRGGCVCGGGEQPIERVCFWERWWGCSHLSALLLSLVWQMRAALGVSKHTMMAML